MVDTGTSDLSGGGQGGGIVSLAIGAAAAAVLILFALLLTVYIVVKRRREQKLKALRNTAEQFVVVTMGANASSTSGSSEIGVQMHTGWLSSDKGDDHDDDDIDRI